MKNNAYINFINNPNESNEIYHYVEKNHINNSPLAITTPKFTETEVVEKPTEKYNITQENEGLQNVTELKNIISIESKDNFSKEDDTSNKLMEKIKEKEIKELPEIKVENKLTKLIPENTDGYGFLDGKKITNDEELIKTAEEKEIIVPEEVIKEYDSLYTGYDDDVLAKQVDVENPINKNSNTTESKETNTKQKLSVVRQTNIVLLPKCWSWKKQKRKKRS